MSYVDGLSAVSVAPSPGPEWLLPPYNFRGNLIVRAGDASNTYIPEQILALSRFTYAGPEVEYGYGDRGTGASDIAGVTYKNGYWRIYDNQGREVNYKLQSNITSGPYKEPGVIDDWNSASGPNTLPGDPEYLYLSEVITYQGPTPTPGPTSTPTPTPTPTATIPPPGQGVLFVTYQ